MGDLQASFISKGHSLKLYSRIIIFLSTDKDNIMHLILATTNENRLYTRKNNLTCTTIYNEDSACRIKILVGQDLTTHFFRTYFLRYL